MKVKFLTAIAGHDPDFSFRPGETATLDLGLAKSWIIAQICEAVQEAEDKPAKKK